MSDNKIPLWISFRVKPIEYEEIHAHFSKSSCRKLSEYARNVLLHKPVHIKYRNESADHFLSEMLLLKKELNVIGNNYNQVVRRMYSLNHIDELKSWLTQHEECYLYFLQLSEKIYSRMHAIHTQWLSE